MHEEVYAGTPTLLQCAVPPLHAIQLKAGPRNRQWATVLCVNRCNSNDLSAHKACDTADGVATLDGLDLLNLPMYAEKRSNWFNLCIMARTFDMCRSDGLGCTVSCR